MNEIVQSIRNNQDDETFTTDGNNMELIGMGP